MDFRLDEARVKAMLIAMWKEGAGDTLVKVMPFGSKPDPDREIGYCTTIKFIAGRTPVEMESAVGFRSGTKLVRGAEVFLVRPLPTAAQFMYRGHSNTPEGIPTTIKPAHEDYPPGLGVPQWQLIGKQDGLVHLASVPSGEPFRCPYAQLPRPI